jgi:hypothetical protein
MSLVEAIDKLYRTYQTKEMTNTQFFDRFNNLVDVIEHYSGTVGVHRGVTESILAELMHGEYDNVNWRSRYADIQIEQATKKGREKILARMFITRRQDLVWVNDGKLHMIMSQEGMMCFPMTVSQHTPLSTIGTTPMKKVTTIHLVLMAEHLSLKMEQGLQML